jgi:hypothetical protein
MLGWRGAHHTSSGCVFHCEVGVGALDWQDLWGEGHEQAGRTVTEVGGVVLTA